MTDQPADLLTAAAQRIRQGDHRIDIALRGPLAAWLDDAAIRQRANEQAARQMWRDSADIAARDRWVAAHIDQCALAVARAVLGQPAA